MEPLESDVFWNVLGASGVPVADFFISNQPAVFLLVAIAACVVILWSRLNQNANTNPILAARKNKVWAQFLIELKEWMGKHGKGMLEAFEQQIQGASGGAPRSHDLLLKTLDFVTYPALPISTVGALLGCLAVFVIGKEPQLLLLIVAGVSNPYLLSPQGMTMVVKCLQLARLSGWVAMLSLTCGALGPISWTLLLRWAPTQRLIDEIKRRFP